jgi:hypothetical protein
MKQLARRLTRIEGRLGTRAPDGRALEIERLALQTVPDPDLDLLGEALALIESGRGQEVSAGQQGALDRWDETYASISATYSAGRLVNHPGHGG